METKVIVEAMWVLITAKLNQNRLLKYTKLYVYAGMFYKIVVNSVFGQTCRYSHNYLPIQVLRAI